MTHAPRRSIEEERVRRVSLGCPLRGISKLAAIDDGQYKAKRKGCRRESKRVGEFSRYYGSRSLCDGDYYRIFAHFVALGHTACSDNP